MTTRSVDKRLRVLNDKIQSCTLCKISSLEFNIKNVAKGYGKLYGWRGGESVDFFFVGMNPSHRRFQNIEYAFGGYKFDKGTGIEFVKILDDLKIKKKSFVDNLCHCSTTTNRISAIHAKNCFAYLLEELEIFDPSRVIAMGSGVFETLELLLAETRFSDRLFKIWHPNFVISYRRDLMSEYVNEIKRICKAK